MSDKSDSSAEVVKRSRGRSALPIVREYVIGEMTIQESDTPFPWPSKMRIIHVDLNLQETDSEDAQQGQSSARTDAPAPLPASRDRPPTRKLTLPARPPTRPPGLPTPPTRPPGPSTPHAQTPAPPIRPTTLAFASRAEVPAQETSQVSQSATNNPMRRRKQTARRGGHWPRPGRF